MSDPSTHGLKGDSLGAHLDEDRCLDLLHNLLPPIEKKRALSHLAACPACEKLLQRAVVDLENVRTLGALHHQPSGELVLQRTDDAIVDGQSAHLRDDDQEDADARPSRPGWWTRMRTGFHAGLRRPRFRFAAGLAAAAAILLLVFLPSQDVTKDAARLRWLPSPSGTIQLRAEEESPGNQNLVAGLEAYANQDLVRAIELLQMAEVTGQLDTIRRIYLGSALALSGDHPSAVAVLKSVSIGTLPDPWDCEASWSLYVGLKESGREVSADSLLQVLSKAPGEIRERVRQYLLTQE